MADGDTTLIYMPGDGSESRTWVIPARRVRWLRRGAWLGAAIAVVLLVGGVYLAVRAARVGGLEARVAELEAEAAQVEDLRATLEDVEASYLRIRNLFGSGAEGIASEVWLPPPAGGNRTGASDLADPEPTAWPLTQPGFVTRTLLDDDEGAASEHHPGLDIAVPADSYIRAAGAGVVAEVGEDPIYGRFLVIDHGNGYSTRYAHANLVLVSQGSEVLRREVIALSGNTGRSSAPHLHFEVHRDGEPVDPLALLDPPPA